MVRLGGENGNWLRINIVSCYSTIAEWALPKVYPSFLSFPRWVRIMRGGNDDGQEHEKHGEY